MSKDNVLKYFKGLFFTFIATFAFAAFGWIEITATTVPVPKIVVPLVIALVAWTAMFLSWQLVWMVLMTIAGCTAGIGIILGFLIVGQILVQIISYLIPENWATLSQDPGIILVMGGAYSIAALLAQDKETTGLNVKAKM